MNTSPFPEWQGRLNLMLYTLLFRPSLDDAEVKRMASWVRAREASDPQDGPFDVAIRQALASPERIDPQIKTPHADAALRDFFGRVLQDLIA
jgi:hypothetical protein